MQRAIPISDSPVGAAVDRGVAAVFAAVGGGMAYVLARIQPDARGMGTHEQLGMQACSWPDTLGIPCPTCGYTTAACHLVHLQPIDAIVTQPFGALMAAAGLLLAVLAAISLITRRSFVDRLVRLPYGTIAVWSLVLFFGSWLYKYLTFAP